MVRHSSDGAGNVGGGDRAGLEAKGEIWIPRMTRLCKGIRFIVN